MKYDFSKEQGGGSPGSWIEKPLFDTPINFEEQGGIVVLGSQQIAEVTPVKYIPEGADVSLDGTRIKPLPFRLVKGEVIFEPEEDYDPEKPTIGLEPEILVADSEGRPHKISSDGVVIDYPDGSKEPVGSQGHVRESLAYTHECGTEAPYPRGYDEYKISSEILRTEKDFWLEGKGLIGLPISGFPNLIGPEDTSDHPITHMLERQDVLPRFLEYAYCLSEQINIQIKDPESALFAINVYQLLQPVLNIVTASAAIRDGSTRTTLRGHYEYNMGFEASKSPEDYEVLIGRMKKVTGKRVDQFFEEEFDFYDMVPYDWRPIARANGSRSGGIIGKGAPLSAIEFLSEADRQLRGNETITSARTLGWHTDRLRLDKGVIEICNLSHGGGHPEKVEAAHETVIKLITALQEYYDYPHTYKDAWTGIIPRPSDIGDPKLRNNIVDASHVNNMIASFYGKDRSIYDSSWQERTLEEIYEVFYEFANTYSPEPISENSHSEILATLKHPPFSFEFSSSGEVFEYFYSPGSSMTAVEALRLAGQFGLGDNPEELLKEMHAFYREARERRAGMQFLKMSFG